MSRPFLKGLVTCAPVALSILPFAVVVAVSGLEAGLDGLTVAGLSLFIFAGAAQLVTVELSRQNVPLVLVVGAALLVNLRFVMYSASLAPHVQGLRRCWRALMAYLLTDQAFTLALPTFEKEGERSGASFFLGAGVMLWLVWQGGTWLGIILGVAAPPELVLDFCVALAFIGLAVPFLKRLPEVMSALVSMGVYLLASGLPYGLALVPAVVSGMAAGVYLKGRKS